MIHRRDRHVQPPVRDNALANQPTATMFGASPRVLLRAGNLIADNRNGSRAAGVDRYSSRNGAALGRSSSGVLIGKEPQLTVIAERGGSIVDIYVAGELDIAVRGLVTTKVAEVLAGKRQLTMLRVDVTAVTFIDSSWWSLAAGPSAICLRLPV